VDADWTRELFRLSAAERAGALREEDAAPLRTLRSMLAAEVAQRAAPPAKPVWEEAADYVGALFERLDAADPGGASARRTMFAAIADALCEKYAPANPARGGANNQGMKNEKKIYVVVACDRSDTADGTPTKLAQCGTRDEAKAWIAEDMREKCDQIAPNAPTVYDEDKMYYEDGDASTQYGIIEVEP